MEPLVSHRNKLSRVLKLAHRFRRPSSSKVDHRRVCLLVLARNQAALHQRQAHIQAQPFRMVHLDKQHRMVHLDKQLPKATALLNNEARLILEDNRTNRRFNLRPPNLPARLAVAWAQSSPSLDFSDYFSSVA
jgi:hypothetical protein